MHGAAGGVGTAAVQLATAAGCRVTATVRRPELRDAVAGLGAHDVIDPDGFERRGPFDVVLELVGAPNLAADLRSLATGGRITVIGEQDKSQTGARRRRGDLVDGARAIGAVGVNVISAVDHRRRKRPERE